MKILLIKSSIHHKNLNFILKCKIINFTIIDNVFQINQYDLNSFDAVFSPCEIIDVSKFPNIKFIFGPHCCLFPKEKNLSLVKGKNSIYIQPSYWPIEFWHNIDSSTKELNLLPFAFGVDTNKFINVKNLSDRSCVFVYYKNRHPFELEFIKDKLNNLNINYKIFSYTNRYNEQEYLDYLQNSKYGIWVGAHESQGFALEEALSCNVPLLVWNIKLMCQEVGSSYDSNLEATTIPYWSESCGEFFYEMSEFEDKFNLFISKLSEYNPRDFIINNLSVNVCEKNLIDIVNNKFNIN